MFIKGLFMGILIYIVCGEMALINIIEIKQSHNNYYKWNVSAKLPLHKTGLHDVHSTLKLVICTFNKKKS